MRPAAVLRILVSANGAQAAGQLRMVETQAGRTATASEKMGRAVKAAGAAAALGAGVAAGASVKLAVDFDKSMRNVNSIAQLPEKQFKQLEKSVLGLAGKTAQAPKTLAEGLYDIVSSGFKAKQGLVILHASAKAATAGLTDTATSTKAVVAVLNAYHLKAKDASKVSDTLFQTVNRGVITFDQLSSVIGDVLPFASSLGVNLNQVGAAISTMTKEGLSGAEATTRLKNTLVAFLKPSQDMAAAIKATGFQSGETLVKQKGLQGALEAVIKTTDGSKQAVATLFPNIRALGGALSLTGSNAKSARGDLKAFADTTGATNTVLKQQRKSVSFQWNQLKADLDVLAIKMGDKLIPKMREAVHWLSGFVDQMNKGKGAGGQLVSTLGGIVSGVKAFGDYLGQHPQLRGFLETIGEAAIAGKAISITARLTGLSGLAGAAGKLIGGRGTQAVATMEVGTLVVGKQVGGGPGGIIGGVERGAGKAGGEVTAGAGLAKFFGLRGLGTAALVAVAADKSIRSLGDSMQRLRNIVPQGGSIFQKFFGKDPPPDWTGVVNANQKALNRTGDAARSAAHAVRDQFGHAVDASIPILKANSDALHHGAGQLDQFGPKAFSTAGKVHGLANNLKDAGDKGEGARVQVHRLGGALDNLDGKKARVNIDVSANLIEVNTRALRSGSDKGRGIQQFGPGRAMGGIVVGGSGSGDKVPLQAMVEPGEQLFVLNRNASAALDFLQGVNAAVPRFATGGNLSLAHPGSQLRSTVGRMGGRAEGKWLQRHMSRFMPHVGGGSFAGVKGVGGSFAANQKLGHAMMRAFGYPESEWPAFNSLEMAEAGWNPFARNSKSGAFGIPQALPPSKMPLAAQRGDVRSQIAWMLQYIKGRYGSPSVAWGGYYGRGGWYQRGGLVGAKKGMAIAAKAKKKAPTKSRHWNPFKNVYELLTSNQYKALQARWQKRHPKQPMPTGPHKKVAEKLGAKVPIVAGLGTIEDILSNFDVAVQAGDLLPDQATTQAGFILADALKHPRKYHLSPQDVERLKVDRGTYSLSHFQGEVPGADTATSNNTDATQALTDAINNLAQQQKDLGAQIAANTAQISGVQAVSTREAIRVVADVISGQLGSRMNTNSYTPGFGVGARY